MKCKILHESPGRMRIRTLCGPMSLRQADILEKIQALGYHVRQEHA